jgi:hypothetical protein
MSTKRSEDNLNAKSQRGGKTCLMTTDIGGSVNIARPHITVGLYERKPSWLYILQMASWETRLDLKEVLTELTLG